MDKSLTIFKNILTNLQNTLTCRGESFKLKDTIFCKPLQGRTFVLKQGKFGICLAFYAILAFVLALLQQPLLCGALLAFVLLAEGDRWAVRQVLQGFMLSLIVSFFSNITYMVGSFVSLPFNLLFGWDHYGFHDAVQRVFSFIVYVGALVLAVMAVLRLCREQEANVPLLSNLAYRIMGEQKPRPVKQQPMYPQGGYPQPPMPYPPQQAPNQPPQPMPPMQPMQGYPMQPQPAQPMAEVQAPNPPVPAQPEPAQQPQQPPQPPQS